MDADKLKLTDAEAKELSAVVRRIKRRRERDGASADELTQLRTLTIEAATTAFNQASDGLTEVEGSKLAENFNKERDVRPSPFAPAK